MLALAGEFVPFAVNVSAAEASESVRPYLPLVERLGQLFAELNEGRARPPSTSSTRARSPTTTPASSRSPR